MITEATKWADQNYRGGLSPNGKYYDTPFGRWYGLNHEPYCDMFVSWCADKGGEAKAVGKYAYCPSHVQAFRSKGQWFGRDAAFKRGDVIFFTWDGGPTADHVGIVLEDSAPGQQVKTVEGNTARTSGAGQGSGGCVVRKTRPRSTVLGVGRPAYTGTTTPSGQAVTINGKLYGPGAVGNHVTAMGRALVRADCSRYAEGPGPVWGSADTESFRAWQLKLGDTADADGIPGPKQLARLLSEFGDAPAPQPPAARRFTVRKGMTLGGIALALGTTVTGLLSLNPQIDNPDRITEGQQITVPEQAKAATPAEPTATPGPAESTPAEPAPTPAPEQPADVQQLYTVVPGDNLWNIAGAHRVTLESLIAANPDTAANPDLIFPGQRLVIPDATATDATATAAPAPAPAPCPVAPPAPALVESSQPSVEPSAPAEDVVAPVEEAPAAPQPTTAEPADPGTSYSNDLPGWIEQARDILRANGDLVPSAAAIEHRAMVESSGNPLAENHWDSNEQAYGGTYGLLQTIRPTFDAYSLPGHRDILNPVDSIIAGVRYANAIYGSFESIAWNEGGY
ncbi:LysM peptidoglycan-binding domain-containing protein [Kitasatospora purpeofusca]|uniref:LysM peptidoglycan-binding domain-containing protein n=1 Tax=Kitasatospora purpeofusca TaxID=67352 RepID=A0ABZ1TWA8_9ACTN|nr:LysM peptidoglycan-binding domain-containing protein [Kitasatospora purpeofusca]